MQRWLSFDSSYLAILFSLSHAFANSLIMSFKKNETCPKRVMTWLKNLFLHWIWCVSVLIWRVFVFPSSLRRSFRSWPACLRCKVFKWSNLGHLRNLKNPCLWYFAFFTARHISFFLMSSISFENIDHTLGNIHIFFKTWGWTPLLFSWIWF